MKNLKGNKDMRNKSFAASFILQKNTTLGRKASSNISVGKGRIRKMWGHC